MLIFIKIRFVFYNKYITIHVMCIFLCFLDKIWKSYLKFTFLELAESTKSYGKYLQNAYLKLKLKTKI